MPSLNISPPYILSAWIPPEQKNRFIYRLDILGNLEHKKWEVAIELILANNVIRSTGILSTRSKYAIGCGEIALSIYGGRDCKRLSSTGGTELPATYTTSMEIDQAKEFTIAPKVKSGDTELEPGSYSSSKGKKNIHAVTFVSNEKILADLPEQSGVEWTIKKIPKANLLRDYMYGSFLLKTELEWEGEMKGVIEVKPYDIGVFNIKNGPLGKRASLVTQFLLYCKGYRVKYRKGVKFEFDIK
jgi:hypothetical protein